MAMAQVLLGDDGRGYELARRIEGCGVWRAWLGDSAYAAFAPSLVSPAAWEAFMSTAASTASSNRNGSTMSPSKAQIHLQLRARALLYDKASVALFLRRGPGAPSSLSSINPTYLQLHGDDVYFSLEDDSQDGAVSLHQDGVVPANQSQSKAQSRPTISHAKFNGYYPDRASSVGLRLKESESDNITPKHRSNELPDSWYDQFIERQKVSRHLKFPLGDKESLKRTSEGMSSYLKHLEMHKRRRSAFKEEQCLGTTNSVLDNGARLYPDSNEDETLIPEMMFPSNCVPDSAIPPPNVQDNRKVDIYGVLDNLPHLIKTSPAMIERFGIRPDLRVEFGRSKNKGNRRTLSQEQASQIAQKVVARTLASTGLDGGTEVLIEVLSQFLGSHISKLGRILKLLSDSYRKQFSSTELIKMFLKAADFSNLRVLSDYVKDSSRTVPNQNQQQVRALQAINQTHLVPTPQQQVQRLIHQSQLNTLHPQNLLFQQQQQQQQMQQQQQQQIQQQQQQMQQQQLQQQMQQQQLQQQMQQQQQLRRRQMSIPRNSSMTPENERSMAEVKIENMADPPMDVSFSTVNRQQVQFRHQQMVVNHHTQPGHQFKQFTTVQTPQLQIQGSFSVRTPPVKVEGFQELMGGDSAIKHDSDERKLTSPSK